jgi:hypothetical protein
MWIITEKTAACHNCKKENASVNRNLPGLLLKRHGSPDFASVARSASKLVTGCGYFGVGRCGASRA